LELLPVGLDEMVGDDRGDAGGGCEQSDDQPDRA